jgi:hypothetical protein
MYMGDSRHKNSPALGDEDDVTDDFIEDVWGQFAENKRLNNISEVPKGDPRRLIESHAMLAQAVSKLVGKTVSEKQISNIIGPARKGSKWDKVARSVYVKPITKVLKLETLTNLQVPIARVGILHWLARVPVDKFAKLEAALEEARRADASK